MIKWQATFDRNLPAGFDGQFLWDFLHGAFGPSIKPMDFDGVVEWRGWFLVFETKDPGVPIPEGQRRALETALRDKRWTVILCAKRPEDIREWIIWTRQAKTSFRGDAFALKSWCQLWYEDKLNRDPIW